MEKHDMGYTEKVMEMGRHANALISLHLNKPKEFDGEWLQEKLIEQYKKLGLPKENAEWNEEKK